MASPPAPHQLECKSHRQPLVKSLFLECNAAPPRIELRRQIVPTTFVKTELVQSILFASDM